MSNANTIVIEIDTVLEDLSYDEWATQMRENYGVSTRMLQENGPAGGWPIIEYSGTRDALARVLIEHFAASEGEGHDGESVEFYLGEIE